MKKGIIIEIIVFIIMIIILIPIVINNQTQEIKQYYTNEDFGIENYISLIDKDNDGIDDQTDFL